MFCSALNKLTRKEITAGTRWASSRITSPLSADKGQKQGTTSQRRPSDLPRTYAPSITQYNIDTHNTRTLIPMNTRMQILSYENLRRLDR
uniref:Uncharacterized protein n=1 Tax=Leersia perrieri TaxID=77586 RepID=A0A0D9XX49_9ORYZ